METLVFIASKAFGRAARLERWAFFLMLLALDALWRGRTRPVGGATAGCSDNTTDRSEMVRKTCQAPGMAPVRGLWRLDRNPQGANLGLREYPGNLVNRIVGK